MKLARKCNISSEKEFILRSTCIFLFLALIDVSSQVIYEEGNTFMISCAFNDHTRTECTYFLSYFRRRFLGDSTFTVIAYRQMNNSGVPGIDLYRHNKTGVQFQSITCKDSGIYICEVNCRPLESTKPSNLVFRNSQYIYVTVPPGPTTITAFPNITNYQSDTILELTCNASFGTNYLIEKKEWRWEFKDSVSNKWIQYTLLTDITNGPDYKDPLMECKMSQASKLTRVLTIRDNKREYRCYVTQKAENGSDVKYTSHASVFYIPHVMQADFEKSVIPGRTVLTAFPMKHSYEVSTKLEIACRAIIGSDAVDVETEWFWEYNDYNRPDWREYSDDTNVDKGPVYEDRQVKGRLLQVSRVRRSLLLDDSERKYRCYIWIKHGKSPWIKYDQFASVFFIRHVRDPNKETIVATPRLDVLIGGLLGGVVLLTSSIGFLLCYKGTLDRKREKEIESETKYKLSVKRMARRMALESARTVGLKMHQENRSGINRQFSDQHNSPKSISLFSIRKKGSRLKLEYHDAWARRSWSCHASMCIILFITVIIKGGQCRCGGEFSGLYGVVTSENYPLPNTHTGENCTWIIWPLKGTVLFLLKDLNLKGDPTNTAYDCTSHSLEFYNGANGQLIKRICDDNIPAGAIQSLTAEGSLIVIYSIRKTYTKQGFYALFWSSSVTVELPTIVYGPTLLLNCGSKQIQGKQSVTLFRSLDRPVTSNYTPMASIRLGEDRIQDFGSVKGASYSGSIETRISAQINNATCKDSGVYICQIVYRSASNETKSLEIFYPVTVSTEPDRTVLEPNRFKWCYATGSNLTLTCSVSVGKMPEGTKTQLKWQDWTPDIRVWQAYDGVIETDPPFQDSSNDCGVKHVSKLSLTLEAVDTRRFFRCYVVQTGFLENKYEYREFIDSTAAEFKIGNVKNATLPTQSSIQSFPNETQFDLQQVVTLTCNGSIGILQKGYQTDWYWEYSNEGSTQWKSYPVGENIINSQVITNNGSDCHLFQSTSLTIKLSDSDSNRRYRCYVGKNKSTSEFTDYRNFSSIFVIRIKKSQAPKYIEAIIGILAGGLLLVLGMVGFHCYLRVQSRRNTLAKPVKRDVTCKEPEANTVAAASPDLTAKPPTVRLFSSSDDFVERDSTSL